MTTLGLTTDPHAFAKTWRALPPVGPATMRAALLVDPTGFRVSEESAITNVYMDTSARVDPGRAQAQHEAVGRLIRQLGVPVLVFPGRVGLDDGVYPNNVFATAPGRFIVGRMRHEVRRREAARGDIRALFTEAFGYELVDLSAEDILAELTGVLAIDRRRGTSICGMSPRVDLAGAAAMHEAFGLRLTLTTPLVEGEYHLNLVAAVLAGESLVMWDDGFVDAEVPRALTSTLGHRVLHLTRAEKDAFAGNCIAVTPADVVLSSTAWDALTQSSRDWFDAQGLTVHPVDVSELEKGGGSLRCLVAEVF
jgi:N-dimethylarginine dimethylaminohydrolase